ncbi:MAG: hypothetical protein RLZZ414_818 [Bacteroidota bacterium]|jgi:RHS repeat-associated protein
MVYYKTKYSAKGSSLSSLNYRFGYQGSEKDNEVNSSNGSSYTTEFRQLDTRLGRWFSVDPVFQPWQSSYTSMDNNPVNLTDVLGDQADGAAKKTKEYKVKGKEGPYVEIPESEYDPNKGHLKVTLGDKSQIYVKPKPAQQQANEKKEAKTDSKQTDKGSLASDKKDVITNETPSDKPIEKKEVKKNDVVEKNDESKKPTLESPDNIDYSQDVNQEKFEEDLDYIVNGTEGNPVTRFVEVLWRDFNAEDNQETVQEVQDMFTRNPADRSKGKKSTGIIDKGGKYSKEPPGSLRKLKGGQGWKDKDGNIWKKDMKHKDHWDVTDPKTNKKVKEIDFSGNQIWPDGPKNKNKR